MSTHVYACLSVLRSSIALGACLDPAFLTQLLVPKKHMDFRGRDSTWCRTDGRLADLSVPDAREARRYMKQPPEPAQLTASSIVYRWAVNPTKQ